MTPADGTKSSFDGGGKSKAQLVALEKVCNNMTLFQFYTNDGVEPSAYAGTLKNVYYASTPAEVKSFQVYGKSGAKYDFYAVANVGNWSSKLTKQVSTIENLKKIEYVNNSISSLTASTGLPLVMNVAQPLKFSGTSTLTIQLKHLTARVEVIVNASALSSNGNSFAPSSLQILKANNTNCPFNFGNNVATASNLVTSDYAVGDDITNLGNGTGVYFYCLENAQEAPSAWKSNTDPSKKIPANFGDECTYLELKGIYEAANGRVSSNTYRVMLGGNNTNDVKVLGGKSYEITLNLSAKGAEAQTWKAECTEGPTLKARISSVASEFKMADGTTQFNAELFWCPDGVLPGDPVRSIPYKTSSVASYSWSTGNSAIIYPEGTDSSVQNYIFGSTKGEVSIGVNVTVDGREVSTNNEIFINGSDTPVEEITTEDNRTCEFQETAVEVSTDGTAKTVSMYPNYTGKAKVRMEPVAGFKYKTDGMSVPVYATEKAEKNDIDVIKEQLSYVDVAYTGTASTASTTMKSGVYGQSGYNTSLAVTVDDPYAGYNFPMVYCTYGINDISGEEILLKEGVEEVQNNPGGTSYLDCLELDFDVNYSAIKYVLKFPKAEADGGSLFYWEKVNDEFYPTVLFNNTKLIYDSDYYAPHYELGEVKFTSADTFTIEFEPTGNENEVMKVYIGCNEDNEGGYFYGSLKFLYEGGMSDIRRCTFQTTEVIVESDGTYQKVSMLPNYTGFAKVRMEPVEGFQYRAEGMSDMVKSTIQPEFDKIPVTKGVPTYITLAYNGSNASASTTMKSGVAGRGDYDLTVLTVKAETSKAWLGCTFSPDGSKQTGYDSGTYVTISNVTRYNTDGTTTKLSSSQYTVSVSGGTSSVISNTLVLLEGTNKSSIIKVTEKSTGLYISQRYKINDKEQ